MAYGYIYRITNSVNDKVYYGQTTQDPPTDRWKSHQKDVRINSKRGCLALHNAMRLHGIDNFNFEVLLTCETQGELDAKEIEMISNNNSLTPNGYNLKHGGHGGGKHGEQTKLKMKLSHTGKIFTDAHKLKLSEASKNMSEDSRNKISDSMKGNKNHLGKKHSEEAKLKMRDAWKKRLHQAEQ
jgi:group I intron endonuclease